MHGTVLYTSQDTPATLSTLEWYIYRMKHCQATRSYLYRGRREVQLLNASRPRGGLVTHLPRLASNLTKDGNEVGSSHLGIPPRSIGEHCGNDHGRGKSDLRPPPRRSLSFVREIASSATRWRARYATTKFSDDRS